LTVAEITARYVTCAGCGKPALGRDSQREILRHGLGDQIKDQRLEGGRIKGRPYCMPCLEVDESKISGISGGIAGPRDVSGEHGSWDNAIRRHEG
jgi:hypothetical protein